VPDLELQAIRVPLPVTMKLIDLRATMLWPHDQRRRDRASISGYVQFHLGMAALGSPGAVPVNAADHERLARSLKEAEPQARIVQREAKRAMRNGLLAGNMFLCALDEVGKLEDIKQAFVSQLRGTKHFARLSRDTFDHVVWKDYQRVLHWWGAVLLRGDAAFPCSEADWPWFRRLAEHLQQRGIQCQPKHHKGTLLDPETIWRVPAAIDQLGVPFIS
jgi:hypothetical protein